MTKDHDSWQPDRGHANPPRRRGPGNSTPCAVSSRRRALEQLQAAVDDRMNRPLLLTGEPGAGKSWLAGRLVDSLPTGWRALSVELTSTLDALEFLRLVADALGLPMTERVGVARLRIRAALEDDARDGRNWLLIVDEVHRGSSVVWEEIDSLAGSLGRVGGFSALLLLARPEFVREMTPRRLEGRAVRSSLHLHLMPLDLDEARELLGVQGRLGKTDSTSTDLEELHRDALGNPRLLMQIADLRPQLFGPGPGTRSRNGSSQVAGSSTVSDRPGSRNAPRVQATGEFRPLDGSAVGATSGLPMGSASLIPTKPPIRLEEGLVEVGWDGDLEAEPTLAESSPTDEGGSASVEAELEEQVVDDRYAAMQAWSEWSRNRERSVPSEETAEGSGGTYANPDNPDNPLREERPVGPDSSTPGKIRPGAAHDFAPYSQLFTRLRQSKQG